MPDTALVVNNTELPDALRAGSDGTVSQTLLSSEVADILSRYDAVHGMRNLKRSRADSRAVDDLVSDNLARNGVLDLTYGDKDFGAKLAAAKGYQTLEITGLPENVHVRQWIDKDGYFFWFQNGTDNRDHHHYAPGLKMMDLNKGGCRLDVAMEQLDASNKFFALNLRKKDGFDSFGPKIDVLNYFKNMSGLSYEALEMQAQALRQGAVGNQNPYFHIYLSDVYMTEAMKPIVDQVRSGHPVDMGNPQTIQKIAAAVNESRQAEVYSKNACYRNNWLPPSNAFLPLTPFGTYNDPYSFWGGGLYQSQRREAALLTMQGLYPTGVLPKYFRALGPNGTEILPPTMPPN